jgi:cyclopropane-fatty-acyl-phospholipid synthase
MTATDERIVTARRGGGAADALFRGIVHRQLRGIRAGRLTLDDGRGATAFGADTDLRAVIDVRDPAFYRSVAVGGTVGAAQSYTRGEWDADDLVAVFRMFARDRAANDRLERGIAAVRGLAYRVAHRLRSNTRRRSRGNIAAHYDLGNEFFALFLDPTMTYSCGIFEREDSTLEDASLAKIDRLCAKLRLGPADHLLEIGTGWGSLAIRAASQFGCRVTTATLSVEQARLARERVGAAGLSDRIEVVVDDYRALRGRYDKLVSVEMIEAVGHDHLGAYFDACSRLLAPDGVMALQAITVVDQRHAIARRQVDLIQHMLFPGADIPSVTAMLDAATRASALRLVHLEDITPHYARTLREWRRRFDDNIDRARELGVDEPFARLWRYYLAYCEAGFAERYTGTVQMLLANPRAKPDPILPPLGAASERRRWPPRRAE